MKIDERLNKTATPPAVGKPQDAADVDTHRSDYVPASEDRYSQQPSGRSRLGATPASARGVPPDEPPTAEPLVLNVSADLQATDQLARRMAADPAVALELLRSPDTTATAARSVVGEHTTLGMTAHTSSLLRIIGDPTVRARLAEAHLPVLPPRLTEQILQHVKSGGDADSIPTDLKMEAAKYVLENPRAAERLLDRLQSEPDILAASPLPDEPHARAQLTASAQALLGTDSGRAAVVNLLASRSDLFGVEPELGLTMVAAALAVVWAAVAVVQTVVGLHAYYDVFALSTIVALHSEVTAISADTQGCPGCQVGQCGTCESGQCGACQSGQCSCETGQCGTCESGQCSCETGQCGACQSGQCSCETGQCGACESGQCSCETGQCGACQSGQCSCETGQCGTCESGQCSCETGQCGTCESGQCSCETGQCGSCESGQCSCETGQCGTCESGQCSCETGQCGTCESGQCSCETGQCGTCESGQCSGEFPRVPPIGIPPTRWSAETRQARRAVSDDEELVVATQKMHQLFLWARQLTRRPPERDMPISTSVFGLLGSARAKGQDGLFVEG